MRGINNLKWMCDCSQTSPSSSGVVYIEQMWLFLWFTAWPSDSNRWFNVPLTRVESGSDDPDYPGHLGHFLVGQAGLIRKLIYLDVTRIFNRSHVL